MAIGAPHLALRDLREHRLPWDSDMHEAAHIRALIPQVIEVQHIWVCLTAVDAGMIAKVVADTESVTRGLSNSSDVSRSDLSLPVSDIPVLRVSTLAAEAYPLASLTDERTKWELAKGLRFIADATDAQPDRSVQRQLQLGRSGHERL